MWTPRLVGWRAPAGRPPALLRAGGLFGRAYRACRAHGRRRSSVAHPHKTGHGEDQSPGGCVAKRLSRLVSGTAQFRLADRIGVEPRLTRNAVICKTDSCTDELPGVVASRSKAGSGWISRISYERSALRRWGSSSAVALCHGRPFRQCRPTLYCLRRNGKVERKKSSTGEEKCCNSGTWVGVLKNQTIHHAIGMAAPQPVQRIGKGGIPARAGSTRVGPAEDRETSRAKRLSLYFVNSFGIARKNRIRLLLNR